MFSLIIFLLGFFGGLYVGQTCNVPRLEPYVTQFIAYLNSTRQKNMRKGSRDCVGQDDFSDDENIDVLHRDS